MREACAIVPDAPRRESAATKLSYRLITRDSPNHEALLDFVQAAHDESRFGNIPFSHNKARRILSQALAEEKRNLIVVVEIKGQTEGFVFASVGEYVVGTEALGHVDKWRSQRRIEVMSMKPRKLSAVLS